MGRGGGKWRGEGEEKGRVNECMLWWGIVVRIMSECGRKKSKEMKPEVTQKPHEDQGGECRG